MQRDRVGPRVAAEQPDGPGVGAQQAEQDPDGGGLPGAVRAEEAGHLAGRHGEVQTVEARTRPKVLVRPWTSTAGRRRHRVTPGGGWGGAARPGRRRAVAVGQQALGVELQRGQRDRRRVAPEGGAEVAVDRRVPAQGTSRRRRCRPGPGGAPGRPGPGSGGPGRRPPPRPGRPPRPRSAGRASWRPGRRRRAARAQVAGQRREVVHRGQLDQEVARGRRRRSSRSWPPASAEHVLVAGRAQRAWTRSGGRQAGLTPAWRRSAAPGREAVERTGGPPRPGSGRARGEAGRPIRC